MAQGAAGQALGEEKTNAEATEDAEFAEKKRERKPKTPFRRMAVPRNPREESLRAQGKPFETQGEQEWLCHGREINAKHENRKTGRGTQEPGKKSDLGHPP